MSLLDLLTLVVLAVVGVQLVQSARVAVGARHHVVAITRGLRARHLVTAVPVLAAVLTALVLLLRVPGMSFGWWTAIGGVGNPVFGTSEHGLHGDATLLVPLAFGALLLVSLPLLVEREEWIFRRGSEQRGLFRNTVASLLFGLMHVLVGIPIAAGFALAIGGAYFTHVYLRAFRSTRSRTAALAESTRAHLGYDLVIVLLVVVAVTFHL